MLRPTLKWSEYITHEPTPRQAVFLSLDCREAFYGGAAGGGKSDALLMAALQYVDVPTYAAILFRRTYTDLALDGALMDRSQEWLAPTDAHWSGQDKRWTFPSGATLQFGYLDTENAKHRYQSAEFQFVGFDELTHFTESQYTYLFSRLRRSGGSPVPIRMRAASNPGGVGHDWVRQRFLLEGEKQGRVFIRAGLDDNPYIDRAEYTASLQELDPLTRAQLLAGDWDAQPGGTIFRRDWFEGRIIEPQDCPKVLRWCRYWDLAATEQKPGTDPDFTAGCKVGETIDRQLVVADIKRVRKTPLGVQQLIRQTAEEDGRECQIAMEQEPGSSGVNTIDHYAREVLQGYSFRGVKTTGSKAERAAPVSSAAENGNLLILRSDWLTDFLNELIAFPEGAHDDQVDALSGAFGQLTAGISEISVTTLY